MYVPMHTHTYTCIETTSTHTDIHKFTYTYEHAYVRTVAPVQYFLYFFPKFIQIYSRYICIHIHAYMHLHTYILPRSSSAFSVCEFILKKKYEHTCGYVHTLHTRICIHTQICIHTHICTHAYIYIHTYIHTYIQTYAVPAQFSIF